MHYPYLCPYLRTPDFPNASHEDLLFCIIEPRLPHGYPSPMGSRPFSDLSGSRQTLSFALHRSNCYLTETPTYNRMPALGDAGAFQTLNRKGDTMKPIKSVFLILSVLFLFHSIAFGIDRKEGPEFDSDSIKERRTLRGIKGLYVTIEIEDELIDAGLLKNQVKTDIEEKLRKRDIEVRSLDEYLSLPNSARLDLNCVGYKHHEGDFYFFSNMNIIKKVPSGGEGSVTSKDEDSEKKILKITWSKEEMGKSPDLKDIRSSIKDLTDQFINNFLSVNRKKEGSVPFVIKK